MRMEAAAQAHANANHSMPTTAGAAEAAVAANLEASGSAKPRPTSAPPRRGEAWPPKPKRRKWYKVVAVVMSKRGGRESHRFVDIVNGVSEFHFGRTTTRYDGSLLVGPPVPAHGFEVSESIYAALSQSFPPEARHVHSPRALLEVMVGGQPMVADGRIFFVQLTPVRLLADPARFAVLHKELFGDEFYLPAPPLTTVPAEVETAEQSTQVKPIDALAAALAQAPRGGLGGAEPIS